MSDNWVVQNLQNALDTWNSKLAEIWQILTQSPETFKGGGIWQVHIGKKTGTRIENFYMLCDCKRSSHVWTGADDGII